jgi:D-lactate dehydrogenase (cytochrome)
MAMSISSAIEALSGVLGDALSLSKSDLENHGASETYFAPAPPDAVTYPADTAQVAQIVSVCAEHDCPVVGFGAGTSLEGHTSAIRGGVAVDFSKMNRLIEVNADDMDARVQPGMTRKALNQELRATGLFFPVDPGADATLGGMASTRASGTTTVRYGTMRDNVIGLEVVLADGRVIRTGTRARKSSAGYDLTGLFVGAEGTLGLITELTLRLHGQPEETAAAVAGFEKIEDAVDCVIATIQTGIPMARIEYVDALAVRAVNAHAGMSFSEKPHLLVEFHGSASSVAEDAERLGELIKDFGGTGFAWATKTEDRNRLWEMRHMAYYSCLALRPGSGAVVTDVCVPISRLAEAISTTRQEIDASGLIGPILGHVGDGNYHAILLVDRSDPGELEIAKRLATEMSQRALALGGTITGEHGVGQGKMGLMAQEHGDALGVMRQIKATLDPKDIMNPGKLIQRN